MVKTTRHKKNIDLTKIWVPLALHHWLCHERDICKEETKVRSQIWKTLNRARPFLFWKLKMFIFQRKIYFTIIMKALYFLSIFVTFLGKLKGPISISSSAITCHINRFYFAKSVFHKYCLIHRQFPLFFSNWQENTFGIDIDHITNSFHIFKKRLNPCKID